MQIKITNIGPISQAKIDIDSITVLCGKNSIGKTTVGRCLYSSIASTIDLNNRFLKSKHSSIDRALYRALSPLRGGGFRSLAMLLGDGSPLVELSVRLRRPRMDTGFHYSLEFLQSLLADVQKLAAMPDDEITPLFGQLFSAGSPKALTADNEQGKPFLNHLEEAIKEAMGIVHDDNISQFASASINSYFLNEFSSQIQSFGFETVPSAVSISFDKTAQFHLEFLNNRLNVKDGDSPLFDTSHFDQVFFVDDPFAIDDIDHNAFEYSSATFFYDEVVGHEDALLTALQQKTQDNLYEAAKADDAIQEILNEIDKALPGSLSERRDEGWERNYSYKHSGKNININNLAAGCKSFLIIKTLLTKGLLGPRTLLILDEPESHLHPEWLNVYAKAITLIAKKTGCKIVLTTHSVQFLLAMETSMMAQKMMDSGHFYLAVNGEGGLNSFCCVDRNLEEIYASFYESLREIKDERDRMMRDDGND